MVEDFLKGSVYQDFTMYVLSNIEAVLTVLLPHYDGADIERRLALELI